MYGNMNHEISEKNFRPIGPIHLNEILKNQKVDHNCQILKYVVYVLKNTVVVLYLCLMAAFETSVVEMSPAHVIQTRRRLRRMSWISSVTTYSEIFPEMCKLNAWYDMLLEERLKKKGKTLDWNPASLNPGCMTKSASFWISSGCIFWSCIDSYWHQWLSIWRDQADGKSQ